MSSPVTLSSSSTVQNVRVNRSVKPPHEQSYDLTRRCWASGTDRPYGVLADWTLDRIAQLDDTRLAGDQLRAVRPSESTPAHHTQSINSRFTLWAHQWQIAIAGEHRATCRMVLIQGQQSEIINTWVFPVAPTRTPVMAAELIALSGAPRLTFIDIQTPGMVSGLDRVAMQTHRLRADFAAILSDEAPPAWAVSDSEGGYVFSRNLTAESFPIIQSCYRAYLDHYLSHCLQAPVRTDHVGLERERQSLEQLDAYQQHHLDSSPGAVFLAKLFGDEWTDRFLHQFLFTRA